MEFIHFTQATGHVTTADGIKTSWLIEDGIGVCCLHLTDKEIGEIKRYGNRIYLATPAVGGRPTPVVPMIRLPIAPTMTISKDADEKKD